LDEVNKSFKKELKSMEEIFGYLTAKTPKRPANRKNKPHQISSKANVGSL
jgi:hypothetical protein